MPSIRLKIHFFSEFSKGFCALTYLKFSPRLTRNSLDSLLARFALAGVGLSLDPEEKEKGSWWHSTSDLILIARDAVVLLIVALAAAHTNAQNTKLGHYSTAVSIRSEVRMARGWSTPAAVGNSSGK